MVQEDRAEKEQANARKRADEEAEARRNQRIEAEIEEEDFETQQARQKAEERRMAEEMEMFNTSSPGNRSDADGSPSRARDSIGDLGKTKLTNDDYIKRA